MQGRIKIIRSHSHRNLGARNFDLYLYDMFSKEFEKRHGVDFSETPRAKLKLLDGIEKLRKGLTANKEADIEIESLAEDIDFKKTFTRDSFEKLISPVIQLFEQTLT